MGAARGLAEVLCYLEQLFAVLAGVGGYISVLPQETPDAMQVTLPTLGG